MLIHVRWCRPGPAVVLCLSVFAVATAAIGTPTPYQPPFTAWSRLNGGNPILLPRGSGFEARGTFNPAGVRHDSAFVMLFRAQDRQGVSTLGRAESRDGIQFTREQTPVLVA